MVGMYNALLQDKLVIVISGGDTGTDCIGTSAKHASSDCHTSVLHVINSHSVQCATAGQARHCDWWWRHRHRLHRH